MGGPFMMPNVSYGPMLNPTMTRGASLGSGIRSLLGLGNARNFAGGVSRGINWSSLLNNTSKTLSVVREAIPIVKEVGPMMNNMKSMLKVASVFKSAPGVPVAGGSRVGFAVAGYRQVQGRASDLGDSFLLAGRDRHGAGAVSRGLAAAPPPSGESRCGMRRSTEPGGKIARSRVAPRDESEYVACGGRDGGFSGFGRNPRKPCTMEKGLSRITRQPLFVEA